MWTAQMTQCMKKVGRIHRRIYEKLALNISMEYVKLWQSPRLYTSVSVPVFTQGHEVIFDTHLSRTLKNCRYYRYFH